eukprot:79817_1
MPSLPTENGNFSYYYKADEFSQSTCRSVCRFLWMLISITFWSILFLTWWFIADYVLFNNATFYFEHSFDYIDRVIQQILYLLLHFFMLIMITSTIRPYRIIHLIIFKHNAWLIISLILVIIFLAVVLEIPYVILKTETFYKATTIDNDIWCKYNECKFWTLEHIIDYYIYCALLPLLLFILWYMLEFCIFSRVCRGYSLYYGSYSAFSGDSQYTAHTDPRPHKVSGHLQMGLLASNERNLSTDLMELSAFLNESENKRTRTYSTTFSVLFYILLSIFWFFLQILTSLRVRYIRDDFLSIYIVFLIICVVFKYLLKLIAKRLDKIRGKKKDSECHYISIELFMEWYCSFLYWFWLRFMIALNTPKLREFIYAMIIHFLTESYKTTFCSSKFYYSTTSKLAYKFSYSNNKCIKWIFGSNDDSTIDEWNIRTSLDSIIRFFAA